MEHPCNQRPSILLNAIDLHCHTTASDGHLPPLQLYQYAIDQGITTLAITDHDSISGFELLRNTSLPEGPALISGIELSTTWSGMEIHIVGLNFPCDNPDLLATIESQKKARYQRAQMIAEKLSRLLKHPVPPEALLDKIVNHIRAINSASTVTEIQPPLPIQLGRPHFASWLKKEDYVKTEQEAYKKYLNNSKLGNLRAFWPSMSQGTARLRAFGATTVLAHPGKYKLTRTKLKALINDFKLAGGQALEVVTSNQPQSQTQQLASFCQAFGLSASQGSDFHSPKNTWTALGRFPAMPDHLTPVWDIW